MNNVVVSGVNFKYGTQTVLDNCCATINSNQIYALLGPSGCGKTTLLRLILGRSKLQSGHISVFGHRPGAANDRISYMPQNNGLCLHFTVKQTFDYFRHIYRISDLEFCCRYQQLHQLLDLPPNQCMISELSGGQQRRISLSVALISDASLVILDEPTVGIDLLIVANIWKYLNSRCREGLTVLFVTHYIEEAMNAQKVGLMRSGRLLAEDNPRTLIDYYNEPSLESVFLKLCLLDNNKLEDSYKNKDNVKTMEVISDPSFGVKERSERVKRKSIYNGCKSIEPKSVIECLVFNTWLVLVLLKRNMLKYIHMNSAIICILLPATQVIVYCLVYSSKQIVMKAAVYNEEVPPFYSEDILRDLNQTAVEHHVIKPELYPTLQSAVDAVIEGSAVGVIWFKQNYSSAMDERVDNPHDPDLWTLDTSSVHLFMDNTVAMYSQTFIYALRETIWKFITNLSKTRDQISFEVPIDVERTELSKGLVLKDFGLSANLLFFLYLSQMVLSSLVLTQERKDGLFERSLIAGVSHHLVLISHFLTNIILSVIQILLMYSIAFLVFNEVNNGSAIVILTFLFTQALNAITSGLLISSIFKEEFHCIIILGFFCGPQLFTTGMFWPLESLSPFLRYASLCSPLAIPVETMRNIVLRGWSATTFSVVFGFAINLFSSLVLFILSLFTFKYRVI